MKRKKTEQLIFVVLLCALLLLCACGGNTEQGNAAQGNSTGLDTVITEVSKSLVSETPSPAFSSVGGDWLVRGLVLADADVPEDYYDIYYDNVRAAVKSSGGILSNDRYTEYMRAIIGLTSIGKDPTDVEGYDLTPYLDDYETVSLQGVNAECYAIIAAKLCGYELSNKEKYIDDIIAGMDDEIMKNDTGYADYLSIAIEALSLCEENEDASAFLENGLRELSDMQNEDGSFGTSVESTAECIIALTQAGVDPQSDEKFLKDENDPYDGLMLYYNGNGMFRHMTGEKDGDAMASEKALLALDALKLFKDGKAFYE